MFDFFRDVILEASGIDSDAAAEERNAKREARKKDRFIFSVGAKVMAFILGIIYLIIAWFGIAAGAKSGSLDAFKIIRFVFLSGCDIACLVCLAVGKKKTEIAALILMILFVVGQYFTTLLL